MSVYLNSSLVCVSMPRRTTAIEMLLQLFVLAVTSISVVVGLETCCGDLGCFSSDAPFFDALHRPFSSVPNCNVVSKLRLILSCRESWNSEEVLDPYSPSSIKRSNFNITRPTKITVNGYTDHYDRAWWREIRDELLREDDFNVIRVDWSGGSTPPFIQAVANARLVGAYLAKFVNHLISEMGYDAGKIHLIGHSLGAHIAGYAGKQIVRLARITGLDPSGHFFANTSPDVRLDITDALIVDTINTNGRSLLYNDLMVFGSSQPFGHMNFYPNGGGDQPGCDSALIFSSAFQGLTVNTSSFGLLDFTFASTYQTLACSHIRALTLFQETIGTKKSYLKAFQCESYEKFIAGNCFSCSNRRCSVMGLNADTGIAETYSTEKKSFYLKTSARPDYSVWIYRLKMVLKEDSQLQSGNLFVTLYGSKTNSSKTLLGDGPIGFSPGEAVQHVFGTQKNLGKIHSIVLFWESTGYNIIPNFILKRYLRPNGNIELLSDSGTRLCFKPERGDFIERKDYLATAIEEE